MAPNLNRDPIEPHRQLGLTLYRLGHGCSYTVIEDLFGISMTLAANTFTKVIRVLIHEMYDEYVRNMLSHHSFYAGDDFTEDDLIRS